MPLVELADSGQIQVSTTTARVERRFRAIDYGSTADVYADVLAATPVAMAGLLRSEVSITPQMDARSYEITVVYLPARSDDPVDTSPPSQTKSSPSAPTINLSFGYTFDTTGATANVKCGMYDARISVDGTFTQNMLLQWVDTYIVHPTNFAPTGADEDLSLWIVDGPPQWRRGGYRILAVAGNQYILDKPPAMAPPTGVARAWLSRPCADFRCAINVTQDSIEGVDIVVPKLQFTREVSIPVVTLQYLYTLSNTTGCINSKRWYWFEPGELLYLGAQGRKQNNDLWSVTHSFLVSPNRSMISVGPDLVVPYKRGHQYLWVKFEPREEFGIVVQRPYAAYVVDVYPEADFSVLGIGL